MRMMVTTIMRRDNNSDDNGEDNNSKVEHITFSFSRTQLELSEEWLRL